MLTVEHEKLLREKINHFVRFSITFSELVSNSLSVECILVGNSLILRESLFAGVRQTGAAIRTATVSTS